MMLLQKDEEEEEIEVDYYHLINQFGIYLNGSDRNGPVG